MPIPVSFDHEVCEHNFCIDDLERMYGIKECDLTAPFADLPVCWQRACTAAHPANNLLNAGREPVVVIYEPTYCDFGCWKERVERGYPRCAGGEAAHVKDSGENEWFSPTSLKAAEVDYPRGSVAKAGVCWEENQPLGSVEFHHVSTSPVRYNKHSG